MVNGGSRAAGGANHEVLRFARAEAARLGHSYIGAEHLLLGLLRTQDAEILEFLQRTGAAPEDVRRTLEAALPGPERAVSDVEDRPFSSRCKKIVALVEERARSDLRHATCRDFLEAMLREGRISGHRFSSSTAYRVPSGFHRCRNWLSVWTEMVSGFGRKS